VSAHPAALKLDLARRGVSVDASVARQSGFAQGDTLTEYVTRSLDLVLPGGVRVSAPVEARAAAGSPFTLVADGRRFQLVRRDDAGTEVERLPVRAIPRPGFYERRTSRGTPMWRAATVQGNHLLVAPGGACGFSVRGMPCRFCVEGARGGSARDAAVPVEDVLEAVRAAFAEGVAEFVYFNTAAYDADDGGLAFLAPYIEAVRRHFDTLVAAQVHPPRTNRWIDRAYAMGVDAISFNLEIFDAELLERHCVGRARYIGRDRYLEALAYAAEIFPSGTVWSDLVFGLEPPESTMAGIEALARMSAVPVVTVFRSLEEGTVRDTAPAAGAALDPVLAHLFRSVRERGTNMGWMRDLALGVTPLEARHFAGDGARFTVAVQQLTRSRLGALATRSLARFRRKLRVRTSSEELFESAPS
jgi:hypothetical protein